MLCLNFYSVYLIINLLFSDIRFMMLRVKTNAKLTMCLCFVALFQPDIDLHDRHMLDLNLQPKTGLEQDVKG